MEITAGGGLKIKAGGGVIAEYQATGNLNQSIAKLSQTRELAWMGTVRAQNPDVDWRRVTAAYERWDHKQQGLTEAGAAVVALAVSVASAGSFSALAGTIAGAIAPAGAGAAATQVAVNAAVKAGI